ncbi:hypothetical protein ASPZODRAFT_130284 [Penicilliopsis zonata CBS 506.65]|uniref:Uncharacterized protein n=1 Tax=Penicilliopsis zonata CBS 506.65 TaxID=1073090 RepID=A0A1L9SMP7_9EURO|nr:hypothetical protein ASPZODRAFT_130284 [Penicilliopsis zonata CBS 506.65]OJJ48307.1 hypothetical protein ASPZODRAFT_130284 [Penicilliopsis zonata CBS 506.65]
MEGYCKENLENREQIIMIRASEETELQSSGPRRIEKRRRRRRRRRRRKANRGRERTHERRKIYDERQTNTRGKRPTKRRSTHTAPG